MTDYNEILKRARKLAEERKPEAGPAKWNAFANSVAYAVTGWSGGYGGPSVREHAAARIAQPIMGFDETIEVLIADDGVIFGQIVGNPYEDLLRWCWVEEKCSCDDPADIAELSKQ